MNKHFRYSCAAVIAGWLLTGSGTAQTASDLNDYEGARRRMIEQDLRGRDISDPAVLAAMEKVQRHLFVPESLRDRAYADYPLSIGSGQTISQPYIVAFMTQSLGLTPKDRVLEIGTGSGYQAAVLAEVAAEVYTIEIIEALAKRSAELLKSMGYENVSVKAGDGFFGWPEQGPFDAIILTCATPEIPGPLISQLREGGRIILPLGRTFQPQRLVRGVKKGGVLKTKTILPVRFVPMTGKAQKER